MYTGEWKYCNIIDDFVAGQCFDCDYVCMCECAKRKHAKRCIAYDTETKPSDNHNAKIGFGVETEEES